LIGSFGNEDGVLVLCPAVDVVDEVGAVVGVVDPFPAEGQLVVAAVLRPRLLNPGVNVMNLFPSVTDSLGNIATEFVTGEPLWSRLMFVGARTYQIDGCPLKGRLLPNKVMFK